MIERAKLGICAILLVLCPASALSQDDGFTFARRAIEDGRVEALRSLLDQGLDEDERDGSGNTLLMSAVLNGKVDAVELLLDRGADVDASNQRGTTGLMMAVASGNSAVVGCLIEAGARANNSDPHRSEVMTAVRLGHREITRLLLKSGADVNIRDGCGLSPLMIAAAFGNVKLARLLLESGADVDASSERFQVLLKSKEGDKSFWTDRVHAVTPLMFAAEKGDCDLVFELLKKDASLDDKDSRGYTAREYAERGGHPDLVKLLDSFEGNGEHATSRACGDSGEDSLAADKLSAVLVRTEDRVVNQLDLVHNLNLSKESRTWYQDTRTDFVYIPAAFDAEEQGTVEVGVLVDTLGRFRRAYVLSCTFEFMPVMVVSSALEAARRLSFGPVMKGGKPVSSWVKAVIRVVRKLPGN